MLKIVSAFAAFFVIFSHELLANPYDACKDILRDGVRDSFSDQSKIDRSLAEHNQFCSMAKHHNLNESNFNVFAKDFAKKVKSDSRTYGGGLDVGVKFFSLGANYGQSNNSIDSDEKDIENQLTDNKTKIIDYFNQNCGQSSYEEALKSEAAILSKVANKDVVQAWRECMVEKTGFFVDVVPTSLDESNSEIEYNITISWKSGDNIKITNVFLEYRQDLVTSAYNEVSANSNFIKTSNICEYLGYKLISGSTMELGVTHKDRSKGTFIRVHGVTKYGTPKTFRAELPKTVVPEPVIIDNSLFAQEHFCNNEQCSEYRKVVDSQKYTISQDFVRTANQLNAGTCEKCEQLVDVRFCFKNCRYKFRGQKSLNRMRGETPEDLARDNLRYIYPFKKGRYFYNKIRIITGSFDGQSLETDNI